MQVRMQESMKSNMVIQLTMNDLNNTVITSIQQFTKKIDII